jgi:hypothetical protein
VQAPGRPQHGKALRVPVPPVKAVFAVLFAEADVLSSFKTPITITAFSYALEE